MILQDKKPNKTKPQVCLLLLTLNINAKYIMQIVPQINWNLQEAYMNTKNDICVLLKSPKLWQNLNSRLVTIITGQDNILFVYK